MSSYDKTSTSTKTPTKTTDAKATTTTTRDPSGSMTVGAPIYDTRKVAEAEGGGIRDPGEKQGGFFSNIVDSAMDMVNGVLGRDKNTNLDDLPPDLLDQLADGTMLRFAFGPEDMAPIALTDEQEALEEVANILTVNNPSEAVMEYLVDSGRFSDLIWSGHGAEDGLFTTDEGGDASLMDNGAITEMLKGSSIEEMFLAVCNGGKDLDEMLNNSGISTYAYDRQVGDDEAITDLEQYAASGSLDAVEGRSIDLSHVNLPFGMGNLGEIYVGGQHQRGKKPPKMPDLSQLGLGDFAGMGIPGLNLGPGAMDFGGLGPLGPMGPQGETKPTQTTSTPTTPATTSQLGPVYEAQEPSWQASRFDRGMIGADLGGLAYV